MTTVLDPAKEPSRFLTAAYILALSLIAALTIGSHLIFTRITNSQKEVAEIVYVAGRQRMLAQQIVFYADAYYRAPREKDRQSLDNALFNFELGHQFLTKVSLPGQAAQRRPMSEAVHAIYFEAPLNLDQQVKTYTAAARKVSEGTPDVSGLRRAEAFEAVSKMAAGTLITALEKAAQAYQDETIAEFNRLAQLQMLATGFILIILVLEGLFIFRPLVRHMKSYSRQLLRIALKDPLTGLDNRRAFMERSAAELVNPERRSFPACVVICDIDKFKAVNDTYGHDVGDRVIQHFAHLLKRTLRGDDVISRIGGEEFALILRNTPPEKAIATIERLRGVVEATPCNYPGFSGQGGLNFTASFGLVAVANPGLTVEQLLKQADEALYEAKNAGRNKVVSRLIDGLPDNVESLENRRVADRRARHV